MTSYKTIAEDVNVKYRTLWTKYKTARDYMKGLNEQLAISSCIEGVALSYIAGEEFSKGNYPIAAGLGLFSILSIAHAVFAFESALAIRKSIHEEKDSLESKVDEASR